MLAYGKACVPRGRRVTKLSKAATSHRACTYTYLYHIYIHTHVSYIHVNIHIRIQMHMHILMPMHIHMHIHIHLHMHIHTPTLHVYTCLSVMVDRFDEGGGREGGAGAGRAKGLVPSSAKFKLVRGSEDALMGGFAQGRCVHTHIRVHMHVHVHIHIYIHAYTHM